MESIGKGIGKRFPLKIAALYVVIGGLWILFSDVLLGAFVADPAMITRLSIYKGWLYVFITALFLYWMIRQHVSESGMVYQELKERERHNRVLFELSPIGLVLCRMDGTLIEVNLAYTKIIGRTVEETLRLSYWDITPEKYTEQEQEQLESLRTTGRYGPYEKEYLHKEGRLAPVRLQGRMIELRGEKFIWSSVEEITERKHFEENMREREMLLRLFAEHSPAAIAMLDQDMKYILVSNRWLSDYGLGAQNVIGRSHYEVFPEIPEHWREIHRRCLAGATEKSDEEPFVRADGSTNWIRWEIHPWNLGTNEIGGIIIFSEDISGRKRSEEALQKLAAELEQRVRERTGELKENQSALLNLVDDLNRKTEELAQANLRLQELDRLKSMFIASMSHELRTPLNSIIGFTGIILMGMSGEISAVQKKQLGMVRNSANHLLDLINDVIDVSKIEAGKTDLTIETFDLFELTREVQESFAVAASEKGLNLEWKTKGVAEVTSDRRRVRQILVNLVGNAVKFTETGTVAISVLKTATGAEINVRDTGIGMHPEDMERLFHAFSRIHIQDRPIVEGTGLGLYLSRRIAALLGGEITAESEPGRGSEFTLFLPPKHPEDKE